MNRLSKEELDLRRNIENNVKVLRDFEDYDELKVYCEGILSLIKDLELLVLEEAKKLVVE